MRVGSPAQSRPGAAHSYNLRDERSCGSFRDDNVAAGVSTPRREIARQPPFPKKPRRIKAQGRGLAQGGQGGRAGSRADSHAGSRAGSERVQPRDPLRVSGRACEFTANPAQSRTARAVEALSNQIHRASGEKGPIAAAPRFRGSLRQPCRISVSILAWHTGNAAMAAPPHIKCLITGKATGWGCLRNSRSEATRRIC